MKELLRKRWFLILLLGGVSVAWFFPHWLKPASSWVEPKFVVASALFLMAWSLESRSLFGALFRPLPAVWAVVISYGALPALAWIIGWFLRDADLRVGLMIIASVPCTLASAVLWTRLASGNEATALLGTLLSTATSWLATTAWLTLATGTEVAIEKLTMMRELAVVLIVPVVLGQLFRAAGPFARIAGEHQRILGVFSQLLTLSIILKAAVDMSDRLASKSAQPAITSLAATALICLAIHLAALAGGMWSSRVLRFGRGNQVAVGFACSQKTLPVALYVFNGHFQEAYPLAVVPLFFYHVGQLLVDTFIADLLTHDSNKRLEVASIQSLD